MSETALSAAPPRTGTPSGPSAQWTTRARWYTGLNLLGSLAVAAAAGAGSPLFVYDQGRWGFADGTLTVMFSVYAFTLLVTLLTAGSLSDHVGRRPVMIGALLLLLVACGLHLAATSAEWVVVARAVQGISTGAAIGTFTAMVSETVPPHARGRMTQIAGTIPIGGLALGALFGGVAVAVAPAPSLAVFVPIALLVVVALGAVLLTPESSSRVAGAWRSLVPRVAVPRRVRPEFLRGAWLVSAAWMSSGLFLGLMPSLAHHTLGLDTVAASALVFLQPAVAAVAGLAATGLAPRTSVVVGALGCAVGGILLIVGIGTASTGIVVAAALAAGIGNGLGFAAVLRPLSAAAHTHERGGLMAAIYVVAYLSYGVPALVAGQLATVFALPATAIGYAAFLAAVALVALASRAGVQAPGADIPGSGAATPGSGVSGSGAATPGSGVSGSVAVIPTPARSGGVGQEPARSGGQEPARSGGLEQGEKK
ncbi:MFS transporter [Microbacterium sp. NPDC016588]